MRLVLTNGFDGEVVQVISESSELSSIMSSKNEFLEQEKTKGRFRIVPFGTHTFHGKDTIVDFGDYRYFLKIEV